MAAESWIANASPLILLGKAGLIGNAGVPGRNEKVGLNV
jgi:hypothetical protein